jgi:hypothetical protein
MEVGPEDEISLTTDLRKILLNTEHMNLHFGGKYYLHLQGPKSEKQNTSVQQVLGQFLTLMMQVIRYIETSVHI